jgi:hypothetical protein
LGVVLLKNEQQKGVSSRLRVLFNTSYLFPFHWIIFLQQHRNVKTEYNRQQANHREYHCRRDPGKDFPFGEHRLIDGFQ